MRWKIEGAHKKSGEDCIRFVDAPSRDEAVKNIRDLYVSKVTPAPHGEKAPANGRPEKSEGDASPLAGFIGGGEKVIATLATNLVLTNKKLIYFKKDAVIDSTSLPLESINFINAGRSLLLGIVVIIIGSLFASGSVGGVANYFEDKDGRATSSDLFICLLVLAIGIGIICFGIYLLRRKTLVFSTAGGSQTFSYLIGGLVGFSLDGIAYTMYCPADECRTFMSAFFTARDACRLERARSYEGVLVTG